MIRARVIGCGSYLPSNIVTNDDLAKRMDTSDEWIRERTGITQRHIAVEGEKTSDLALGAARAALTDAGIDAGGTGALAKVFDRNLIQPRHQFFLQGHDERRDDTHPQVGAGRVLFLVILDAFGDAHDITHRNAAAFARQAVAAARSTHAFQNAGAHKLLHHLFQIALRHALPGGDLLGLYRFGPGIEGDVDHRLQRQKRLA